jgi:uncharacterized RDD family membrane protein YckC
MDVFLYLIVAQILILLLVSFSYYSIFTAVCGQTVGKRLLRIKVVLSSGEEVDAAVSIKRYFCYLVSGFTFFGFLSILFDKNRQGWHDKWSKTCVIRIS